MDRARAFNGVFSCLSQSNSCSKPGLSAHSSGRRFLCAAASHGCIKSPIKEPAARAVCDYRHAITEQGTRPGQTICKEQSSSSPEGGPGIAGHGRCQLPPITAATFLPEPGLREPRGCRICPGTQQWDPWVGAYGKPFAGRDQLLRFGSPRCFLSPC